MLSKWQQLFIWVYCNQTGKIWEYFHVFACWCAYTHTTNSTNKHKNMETPPDFLTSTVVQMKRSTKNLILSLGKKQTIKWERLGTWLRRLSIFKTNVIEKTFKNIKKTFFKLQSQACILALVLLCTSFAWSWRALALCGRNVK